MTETASPLTISMVMIAKDEEENVRTCFDSFWDDVDEVVLVDTGSTDDTVAMAQLYAREKGETQKLKVGYFKWCNDFAAARNYADSLATGTWRSWIDLDDVAAGIPNLRRIAAGAPGDLTMLYTKYDYAVDEEGHCFCELERERLVRTDVGIEWVGRVHECQAGPGTAMRVERKDATWTHRRKVADEITDRNELLLREWIEEEPDNARAVGYLAFELMGAREHTADGETIPNREKVAESIPYFQRYLQMPGQPPDARAQAARRLSQVFMSMGNRAAAKEVTLSVLAECPWWPDTLLTLAEIAHENQEWPQVFDLANQVLERGQPDTMLIVNPEDYTLKPLVLIASARAVTGQIEEAVNLARRIVAVNPHYMGMQNQLAEWLGTLAREQAGVQWANCAQLLIQNDEPEKAIVLLQTVPYFTKDHPSVVAARVAAANALSEPYRLEQVGDSARGNFLVRSLRELQEEQAAASAAETPDAEDAVLSDEIDAELAYGRD